MILKNSFLADICENMKRRNWVFSISFLLFLCYFPWTLILAFNNIRTSYDNRMHSAGIEKEMKQMAESVLHLNLLLPVFVIGLAILLGIQGFSYLHDKRQVDFYHSQPVKRSRRFFVLWLNGILVFVITYLINLFLGTVAAASYGAIDFSMICGALSSFLLYFLLFLAVYHLAVLATLLTGNTLVSLLAVGVFLGYELAARAMTTLMASSFFLTYGWGEEEKIFDTLCSPIVDFYQYVSAINYGNSNKGETYGETVGKLLIQILLFGGLCFYCYKKRNLESHGKSISFSILKEPLRFLLLLLFGSAGSMAIYNIAGKSLLLGIFGGIFFVLLGHGILQVIYEVDFRAIRKRWKTMLLSLAAVILVFLGFRYDLSGYDRRIPRKEKVESIYLLLEAEGHTGGVHVLEDGTEIYGDNYTRNHMELKELDLIYNLLDQRAKIGMDDLEERQELDYLHIIFRLQNGKTESRKLYMNYEDHFELLDQIYHLEEYQLSNQQPLEEDFISRFRVILAEYENGISSKIIKDVDLEFLMEAYKKDLAASEYKEVYYELPVGKIRLSGIGLRNTEYRNNWELLVYDSYENTINILEKAGIVTKEPYVREVFSQVQEIKVTYFDNDKYDQGYDYEECETTITYQSEQDLKKLLPYLVSQENRWWPQNQKHFDHGITVNMNMRSAFEGGNDYVEAAYFKDPEIPQFILEDLGE